MLGVMPARLAGTPLGRPGGKGRKTMRAVLPLCLLVALAACDPPLEQVFPTHVEQVERAGTTYQTRAKFDPFAARWTVRVSSAEAPLEAGDLDRAEGVAENAVGPLICDGSALAAEPGGAWGDESGALTDAHTFAFTGHCTDMAPQPGVPLSEPMPRPVPKHAS